MADLFIRSYEIVDYKTHPSHYGESNYVRCAAVAPFTVSEMHRLFPNPGSDGTSLCKPACPYWQFRRHQEQVFILVVAYPNETNPTIFSTGISAFREFLDYMEEGVDAIRDEYMGFGFGC